MIEAVQTLKGTMLPVGSQGLSAYEVYKKNGGTLSEEEWLESLNGADGVTPTIGENGNWYLGDTDTGLPSRGEQGEKGETGGVSQEEVIALLTDYATTDYVDEALANNSGGGESYVIGCVCNTNANIYNNPKNFSGTDLTNIENAITSAYDYLQASPIKSFLLYLYYSSAGTRTNKIMYLQTNETYSNSVKYVFKNLQDLSTDNDYTLTISGSWSDSTFTISSASLGFTDTPLATKTYVDDAIAALKAELSGGTE